MIVLHAIWHHELQLCVWGESSDRPTRGVNPTRAQPAPPHPFAIDRDELETALVARGLRSPDGPADTGTLPLALPSTRTGPVASPFLLHDETAGSHPPGSPDRIATWTVPVLVLGGVRAADAVIGAWDRSAGRRAGEGEVVLADDLRFLGELAKLALAQVALGGVVPVLARAGGGFVARWRPAGGGPARAQLARLQAAMPAALRAAEPDRPPAALAQAAFETLVDAGVRRSLDGWRTSATAAASRSRMTTSGRAPSVLAAWDWIDALTATAGDMAPSGEPMERVHAAFSQWSAPLLDATTRSFRTCFRLEPPEDVTYAAAPVPGTEAHGWRLEFLLQAPDDPTVLVPAAEVWRTRGRLLSAEGRQLEEPQERLLEDLGRALRLFPPLAAALREAAPTGLSLDAAGAHDFLRSAAAALEQAGFGVLVPSWWGAPTTRLGLRLRARAGAAKTTAGLLGLDAVCEYDWQVALGDDTLTAEEFRRLAQLKQPLVRVRGQWVELQASDIDAALALIGSNGGRTLTAGDVLRASAGAFAPTAGLPVVTVEADGWLGDLLATAQGERVHAVPTPAGFVGELRPYQQRGLGWLAFLDRLGLGACLADDMGLGKTIQLLALLVVERESAAPDGSAGETAAIPPTLLVCPMSVVGNWQHEAARFAPMLRVHVHHGGERLGGSDFARVAAGADLVLTTYALAARDRDVLADVPWHRIVLDEAQNIKNTATRQSQALRSLAAPRRVALTGTPVENRLTELWSILDFLNPGLLGSQRSFRDRFATPIERYGDEERTSALRRLTGPFILRRVKTDRSIIRDLPEKIDIKEYCNLTREQASLYQAVVDDMLLKIEKSEGMERRGLVLTTMLRLKQVCNHPAHLMADGSALEARSGKLERLEEVLAEAVDAGERALVFTQFAEWGHLLRSHLQRTLAREIAFLHGGTSKADRDRMVERFQSGEGAPVLLLSLRAGGTGLNLTAANHVVHFDRWWNPAVEEQASDRAFRIGQTRNVQVRKFICAGTLEERIDEMIERKKSLAERIVGTGEGWLTELTTDELRRVIALSADAVAE